MRLLSASLLAATGIVLCGHGAAGADMTLRFNRWIPATHFIHTEWLDVWAADVSKATQNRVKVEFTAATLVPPPRQFQLVADGGADLAWHTHAYSPGVSPVSEIGALPFIGDSVEAMSVSYWEVQHRYLYKADEHKGTVVIGMNVTPPGHVYNNKHTIRTLADFQGLKIRSTNTMVTEALKSFGATPILAPVNQIRDGLSKGIMDGTTFTDDAIFTFNVEKFVKYATRFPGGIYNQTFAVIVNPGKWASISAADRTAIMKISGVELGRKLGRVWDAKVISAVDDLKKQGIEVYTAEGQFLSDVKSKVAHFERDWIDAANKKGVDGEAALKFYKASIAGYKKS
jgi:TRAP-type C4-dicarboxylate transport system substrate-binding protein